MGKARAGNYFEDFAPGQVFQHGTPKTVGEGDRSLYTALCGSRFAHHQSDEFARRIGYRCAPIDDLLIFHMVFGKTVNDISLNAIANLGYALCRFLRPVYPGDTLSSQTEVIGLKENSNGKSGTVYVRSKGINQGGEIVLDFVRWVMVQKRDEGGSGKQALVPELPDAMDGEALGIGCPPISVADWDWSAAGSPARFDDYEIGERIDHIDGVTVEEAEHMMAARLYHNNARVHLNALQESRGRFGKRIVYGGHVMSLARALSFNGLANAFHLTAINSGRHVAPLFAGATVFAWSEIRDKKRLAGRSDVGALRIHTRAIRDMPASRFPLEPAKAGEPGVILEFDYWALMPV